ncbi:MAG: hypothetical protein ACRDMZ_12175 [Solirubrobacteraceae bacterium]
MSALAGGYWDDAWHTERGRDTFFIAPHIAIYAGIATAGAALTLWVLLTARTHGTAAIWRHKPLALALLSVAVTLASGPIDNAWHIAFGRDSVIWSAPHMLGIAGTLALGAAILAELAGRPERWARPLTVVAGALVLASAGFVGVEYDTDVPQFGEVFYLPVLGFAASVGLVLVRVASDGRWAATASAAVYTAFAAAVAAFLTVVSFPPPALPLLVLPAVVVDAAMRRPWHPALTAAAYTLALHAAYVPVRNLLGDGVRFDTPDVLVGAMLTYMATLVVFAVAGRARDAHVRTPRRLPQSAAGAASIVLVLLLAPMALAHDPGQGQDAGTVAMRTTLDDDRATLNADLPRDVCGSTTPRAVVARRGGKTLRAALTKRGCRLQGTLRLPERGRWFLYAEMRRDGRAVESWLPIAVRSGPRTVTVADRYSYVPPERSDGTAKLVASVLLYGGMLALLYATFALIRSSRAQREPASPVSARAV